MYELKKNWKGIYEYICWDQALVLWKKKFTGPGSQQRLRNTVLGNTVTFVLFPLLQWGCCSFVSTLVNVDSPDKTFFCFCFLGSICSCTKSRLSEVTLQRNTHWTLEVGWLDWYTSLIRTVIYSTGGIYVWNWCLLHRYV